MRTSEDWKTIAVWVAVITIVGIVVVGVLTATVFRQELRFEFQPVAAATGQHFAQVLP